MTRGFSRRNLVKGAAWAAPAVVASTAIPSVLRLHHGPRSLSAF